jgi:hypothetical protein
MQQDMVNKAVSTPIYFPDEGCDFHEVRSSPNNAEYPNFLALCNSLLRTSASVIIDPDMLTFGRQSTSEEHEGQSGPESFRHAFLIDD